MPDTTQGGQSGDERARRDLIAWSVDESLVGAHNLSRWYKGSTHRRLPDKAQLSMLGLESVGDGWSPAEPLIFPSTRVVAIGSCFARYFILWLAEHGFNKSMPHSPYNALLKFGSRLESPACVAQQFRWAFGELDDKSVFWIDENKEVFEASEERRLLVRDTLLATDVLILTLGLSEIWYDRITGEPLWRALPVDQFDPERHVFAVETMAQTLQWLETIERFFWADLCDNYLELVKARSYGESGTTAGNRAYGDLAAATLCGWYSSITICTFAPLAPNELTAPRRG